MLDKILAFVKYSPAHKGEREPAPQAVHFGGTELALSAHLEQFNGYPILDWSRVRESIDGLEPAQQGPAWWSCERAWLQSGARRVRVQRRHAHRFRLQPLRHREFTLHADRVDSGAGAAHDHLGLDLGDAVQAMLEKTGAWSPRPEEWKK